MKKYSAVVILALLAAAAIATAGSADDSAMDTVNQLHRRYEALSAAKDSSQIAGMYHSEARVLVSGAPIISRRADIAAMWKTYFDKGFTDLKLTEFSAERHGDVIVEIGTYRAAMKEVAESGKYVFVWKQEAGNWKLWIDAFQ